MWVSSRTGKKYRVPKPRHSRSRVEKQSWWLWIYHTGYTKDMDRILAKVENTGGGCCTLGFRDDSYNFKTLDSAKRAALKLKNLPGVAWISINDTSDHIDRYFYLGPEANSKVKKAIAKARQGARGAFAD